MPERIRAELEGWFDLALHDCERAPARGAFLAAVHGQEGVVSMVGDVIDDELLDAAGRQLRVVANYAVGYDNIDIGACTRRGVVVTNTPDVLSAATAELTTALMLDLTRRVSEGDRMLRARIPWTWAPTFMLGSTLRRQLLGIVGLGRIGREVAHLADALGMQILYTNAGGPVMGVPWQFASFGEIVERADVLTLHCPLTPETRHLIDRDVLRAMKRTSYIVNTSRGALIDEAALAEALDAGEIAGAALDVFEREPMIDERFLRCENVVLAPHLGSATNETREAMGKLCISALKAVLLEGRLPENALNPAARNSSAQ